MKVEHDTPEKPEVHAIAQALGIDVDEAFGKLFRMWRWFDKESVGGLVAGVGPAAIDRIIMLKGFADAVLKAGWLEVTDQGLVMPEFAKNCGEGAKTRALTARRVARLAGKTNADTNANAVSPALTRKEKGEREEEEEFPIAKGPIGTSSPVDQSPLNNSFSEEEREPLDLSAVDWECVIRWSEALGKRVPPFTDKDRRQWFKFAVMAQVMFSEHWLLDSAEAVVNASSRSKKNRQAHLVAVLKAKAAAEQDVDASTFRGILRRIEIPADVWKSDVLKVKK